MVVHEFTCPDCDITFDYPWEVGGEVRCPRCEQWFETDWEANADARLARLILDGNDSDLAAFIDWWREQE
jgi:uncharacterized paraquat-inducible protein A